MQIEKENEEWKPANTYRRLPDIFYSEVETEAFPSPKLLLFNEALAEELGLFKVLSSYTEEEKAELFSGKRVPAGVRLISQAYGGHQFGYFSILGDGRAKLIGEWTDPKGRAVDLHLKGSGRTPYSRGGDGRAVLSPMLREYLISEAMFGLGIPTSRSLAVTLTGERVYREGEKDGAVLTRVAKSHLRVGTFQFARLSDEEDLLALADYAILRHFPEIDGEKEAGKNRYLRFFERVMEEQVKLIAKWQTVGFIHGVMNTDNMSIAGETIDYGPCAFMNRYRPNTVFSSIDRQGRYRYENQPEMGRWNLIRLAEALLPLVAEEETEAVRLLQESLRRFDVLYETEWLNGMRKKLGIVPASLKEETEEQKIADRKLIEELLGLMEECEADYTNTFVRLTQAMGGMEESASEGTTVLFSDPRFLEWTKLWKARFNPMEKGKEDLYAEMKRENPFLIPRNHIVEAVLAEAERGDMSAFSDFLRALKTPYLYEEAAKRFQTTDPEFDFTYRTYCGT